MGITCSRRRDASDNFELVYCADDLTRSRSSSLSPGQKLWRRARDKIKSVLALRLIFAWCGLWQNLYQIEKGRTARWANIASIRGKVTAKLAKLNSRVLCLHLVRDCGVLRFSREGSGEVDKIKELRFVSRLLEQSTLNSRARGVLARHLSSL